MAPLLLGAAGLAIARIIALNCHRHCRAPSPAHDLSHTDQTRAINNATNAEDSRYTNLKTSNKLWLSTFPIRLLVFNFLNQICMYSNSSVEGMRNYTCKYSALDTLFHATYTIILHLWLANHSVGNTVHNTCPSPPLRCCQPYPPSPLPYLCFIFSIRLLHNSVLRKSCTI